MNTTVSILAEIPEYLHTSLTHYLESHTDWDQDRLFIAALSLFLVQNGECGITGVDLSIHQATRAYLDSLLNRPG